jgi:hypothetical protein
MAAESVNKLFINKEINRMRTLKSQNFLYFAFNK